MNVREKQRKNKKNKKEQCGMVTRGSKKQKTRYNNIGGEKTTNRERAGGFIRGRGRVRKRNSGKIRGPLVNQIERRKAGRRTKRTRRRMRESCMGTGVTEGRGDYKIGKV